MYHFSLIFLDDFYTLFELKAKLRQIGFRCTSTIGENKLKKKEMQKEVQVGKNMTEDISISVLM